MDIIQENPRHVKTKMHKTALFSSALPHSFLCIHKKLLKYSRNFGILRSEPHKVSGVLFYG